MEIGRRIDAINESKSHDWAICSTFDGLEMIYNHFDREKTVVDNNNRTEKTTRWIGDINRDSGLI